MKLFKLKIGRKQMVETAILLSMVAILTGYVLGISLFFLIAFIILLLALIIPTVFHPFAYMWFGLSHGLGWLMSHLLLTLLFYFLVTPVSWVRRLSGKDSLQLRSFKKNKESVFINRKHVFMPQDLKYPF